MNWTKYVLACCFLFFSCDAGAGEKVEHVCGNGPHTVKVRIEDTKSCHREKPTLNLDDTYTEGKEICETQKNYRDEEWSDWPECKGATSLEFSIITGTTSNIWQPGFRCYANYCEEVK